MRGSPQDLPEGHQWSDQQIQEELTLEEILLSEVAKLR